MATQFSFREITSSKELEHFLKLRYHVYDSNENSVFLKKNIHSIDLECYDEHSKHYGLFCEGDTAGYLRIVLPKGEFVSNCTLELQNNLSQHISIPELKQQHSAPLPFLSYPKIPEALNDYYIRQQTLHRKIIEVGRFIVSPGHRTLKASRFIAECGIAIYTFIHKKYEEVIVNCSIDFAEFYYAYGLIPIVSSDGYYVHGLKGICLSLQLNEASIPLRFRDLFQSMAEEFSKTNQITRTL